MAVVSMWRASAAAFITLSAIVLSSHAHSLYDKDYSFANHATTRSFIFTNKNFGFGFPFVKPSRFPLSHAAFPQVNLGSERRNDIISDVRPPFSKILVSQIEEDNVQGTPPVNQVSVPPASVQPRVTPQVDGVFRQPPTIVRVTYSTPGSVPKFTVESLLKEPQSPSGPNAAPSPKSQIPINVNALPPVPFKPGKSPGETVDVSEPNLDIIDELAKFDAQRIPITGSATPPRPNTVEQRQDQQPKFEQPNPPITHPFQQQQNPQHFVNTPQGQEQPQQQYPQLFGNYHRLSHFSSQQVQHTPQHSPFLPPRLSPPPIQHNQAPLPVSSPQGQIQQFHRPIQEQQPPIPPVQPHQIQQPLQNQHQPPLLPTQGAHQIQHPPLQQGQPAFQQVQPPFQQGQLQFPNHNRFSIPKAHPQQPGSPTFPQSPPFQFPPNQFGGFPGGPQPGGPEPENGYNPYHEYEPNPPPNPLDSEFTDEPPLSPDELEGSQGRSAGSPPPSLNFEQSTLKKVKTEELLEVVTRKRLSTDCVYNTISYGANGEDCIGTKKR